MTARIALLFALMPAAAFAQLQLFTFDGTSEKAAASLTDFGSISAGDTREIRFHARNNGNAAVALTTVSLAGQGFSISAVPSLPYVIAPTNFAEVRVRFSAANPGSYSAMFAVNSTQTLLVSTVVASATVSLANDTIGAILTSGTTLDFGRVQKNKSGSLGIRIANGTNSQLTMQSCAISGDPFHAPALHCPMMLAPGDATVINISFDPKTAGVVKGSLTLDSRTFVLSGIAFDPPLPEPSIAFATPLASGTQQKLAINLAAVSEASGTGTVSLSFQPAPGAADDPAVRFTSSGARNLSFQVAEGAKSAAFPAGVDTVFQTGTTAGTIVFRVQLGDYDFQFPFTIAPASVSIDHASATRRVSDLDVSVTGFDNTRTAGRFSFTFYDTAGKMVQPGTVRADWSELFTNYFKLSKVGGSFTMRATFPVSGDASQIGGVDVEMTNSAGVTRTTRLTF